MENCDKLYTRNNMGRVSLKRKILNFQNGNKAFERLYCLGV